LSKTSLIQDSYYIKRPYYGEDETTVSVDVGINERKRNVQVELHERHYTQEDEINQVMEKAKVYLDKVVLGDNVSYEHVTEPLYLIAKIPDLQVDVSWGLDQKGVVSNSGKITISEEEVEGILVTMTATLDYYDTKILYPINMVVFPKEKTKEEKLLKQLEEAVHNSQVEDPESEYLKLPEVIENQSLTYSDNNSKDRNILILLGAIAVICIGVGGYTQLEKEKKKRNRQMLLDYPDIINKLVLLVGAGMTTKNAWGKMCLDYENKFEINKTSNNKRYVYEEMVATYNEIQNGVTEIEAFDRFGRRVQLVPYMKLSSLLVQNMKRGTADLLQLLEYEAVQAFEERKEVAKRLGEEAGTKLLGPMVLMLFIVLIIIMVPAFMQM
ncbi:secretion protein F, partial [Anaerosporobacter sp.]